MKGNNDIKEALIHWPNDKSSKEALGTLLDWTGILEFKIENDDGSHESFILGHIQNVKINTTDDTSLFLLETDDAGALQPFLSEIWNNKTEFKACVYHAGNCFYQEITLKHYSSPDDESLVIELERWGDIKVWPSGYEIDPDYDGMFTPLEYLANQGIDFWERLKRHEIEITRPSLSVIKGGKDETIN